ncbi:cytochrome P450 [Macrolepiota fuliginosa MF-IS2]|uniref:Cytochrome P450 n=1 Tax=Macrolepiota fuliginosa MF-IS2 TaxID=1400762 RepID=A0A9P5XQ78_9AGAR|nr:cytochrome P450 [Macrolepiota fuliginosa MF-IS2]
MLLSSFHDRDLPSDILWSVCGVFILSYAVFKYLEALRSPLNRFPTIGYSGVLTSYITAVKWTFGSAKILQEGYDRYTGIPFKVATMSKWIVVLGGEDHINDIRKAPEGVVSFKEALEELLHAEYTFGSGLFVHPYHIATVRSQITHNLGARFEDIRDEIVQSFNDCVSSTEDWVAVPGLKTITRIVCRSIVRYFFGLPLCRDPGYCSFVEKISTDVVIGAIFLHCFPSFMKPFVGRYLTTLTQRTEQMMKYLGPSLEKRLADKKRGGHHDVDGPDDLIAWLLESATQDYHFTARDMAMRLCLIYFAALHSTSMALTQGVYDLAIHPEYTEELREEVGTVVAEYGWTKDAVQKMHKVDSFLKESLRLNNSGKLAMVRKTIADWTLSDGTTIPAGTYVGVATDAMGKSEKGFKDPLTFKGFRFVGATPENEGSDFVRNQMVGLNSDQIIFGHGRHACPGRFLAVSEIKTIFAHILIEYDVQLENGSMERPPNINIETGTIPNLKAKLMFRKRRDV